MLRILKNEYKSSTIHKEVEIKYDQIFASQHSSELPTLLFNCQNLQFFSPQV